MRRARLKEFGADLAIDTRDEKWPDQVLEATGGKGVNLTVDMVSGRVNQIMKATPCSAASSMSGGSAA
jgi:NADPH2:quinone reductase